MKPVQGDTSAANFESRLSRDDVHLLLLLLLLLLYHLLLVTGRK